MRLNWLLHQLRGDTQFLIQHWVLGMQALSFKIHWPCRIACDYTLIQLSIQSYRKCESISEAVQLHLYVTNLDWTGYNYQSAAEAQFINTAFAHHFLTKIVGAVHQSIIIMCHFLLQTPVKNGLRRIRGHWSSQFLQKSMCQPPWLFKSFHSLLLGSSSCVCPAMYAWAVWPGF